LATRTWDAFDFFTVSLTVTEIARDFGVENSEVTWVRNIRAVLTDVFPPSSNVTVLI